MLCCKVGRVLLGWGQVMIRIDARQAESTGGDKFPDARPVSPALGLVPRLESFFIFFFYSNK